MGGEDSMSGRGDSLTGSPDASAGPVGAPREGEAEMAIAATAILEREEVSFIAIAEMIAGRRQEESVRSLTSGAF
jgi:hypothetical protein